MTDIAMSTGTVSSVDGTSIGYRRVGSGPAALVILHGSMSSGYNHVELADLLGDEYTTYLPDRRGRGLSGPYRPEDGLETEIADLSALLDHTGAEYVMGVSSGAIIALEAARQRHGLRAIVVFEPPLLADRPAARAILDQFDARMARGDVPAAMVTAMKGAEMGPALLRRIPDRFLAPLTRMAMRGESRKPPGPYVPMERLAPTLHHDFLVVAETAGQPDRYSDVTSKVHLLGGSRSPAYLKEALTRLEASLPNVARTELAGLDHAATWNRDRGGRPDQVAPAVRTSRS